jgi:N-methylhydantoinase B
MSSADPVTREILRHAFHGIAEEMAVVEYRSSFSPIIREMLDFSCGLFDERGRMIAHSEQIPAQLGLMQFTLATALERLGPLAPGDAVLCNHPYLGGTHLPDLQIFVPAFRGRRLIGYAGSIAHHIDVGGATPGSENAENTELFQEGLIFPPLKLTDGGRENQELLRLIAANVRDPESTLGDLAAQLAACRRGVERLDELCDTHGVAVVIDGMAGLLDQTSRRMVAELRRWPKRTVEVEGHMDDDGAHPGVPVRLAASVRVRGGMLEIDLSGSDPQVPSSLNVPWASSHAAAYFAVRCFVGDEIPQNDGLTRHVRVSAPEGSIVRPRFPAAVSARHLTVQRLAELLCRALGDLLPDRAVASSHTSFPAFVFQAIDPRTGRLAIFTDILGGGGGARPGADGDHAIDTYTSNCALLPAEIAELEYPWRIERTELVDGSGGDGRHPGGLGLRRDYRLLADAADGMFYVEQLRPDNASQGAAGGAPGAPARVRLRRDGGRWRDLEDGKMTLDLRKDDVISFTAAGGGGFGKPTTARRGAARPGAASRRRPPG